MTRGIKVSIIIPMYNSDKTILRVLDSVSMQSTTENLQIIVINDGSSDDSQSVVQHYIDSVTCPNRDFLLINQSNRGVASARNVGMKASTGKYITFLDADDYFHPQKLELLLLLFNKNPNIDVVGHSFLININKFQTMDINNEIKQASLRKVEFCNILFKNFSTTPSVMFKNNVDILFDESMTHTEDHDFFLRLSYGGNNMYFLDCALTSLGREVMSVGGLSANRVKMRLGEIKMYINLLRLNKNFILFVPFLVSFSMMKHVVKRMFN